MKINNIISYITKLLILSGSFIFIAACVDKSKSVDKTTQDHKSTDDNALHEPDKGVTEAVGEAEPEVHFESITCEKERYTSMIQTHLKWSTCIIKPWVMEIPFMGYLISYKILDGGTTTYSFIDKVVLLEVEKGIFAEYKFEFTIGYAPFEKYLDAENNCTYSEITGVRIAETYELKPEGYYTHFNIVAPSQYSYILINVQQVSPTKKQYTFSNSEELGFALTLISESVRRRL